jgi:hypothetical protein
MASHLYRTSAMLRSARYVPTLVARAQASQTNPTPGQVFEFELKFYVNRLY